MVYGCGTRFWSSLNGERSASGGGHTCSGRCRAPQAPHHPGRHGKLSGTLRDVYERLTAEGLSVLPPKVTRPIAVGQGSIISWERITELRDAIFGKRSALPRSQGAAASSARINPGFAAMVRPTRTRVLPFHLR